MIVLVIMLLPLLLLSFHLLSLLFFMSIMFVTFIINVIINIAAVTNADIIACITDVVLSLFLILLLMVSTNNKRFNHTYFNLT